MPGDDSQSPTAKATDTLRQTAKWLIAALAAVGAVLVAGTPLSGIGKLTPEFGGSFLIAVLGGSAALLGVIAAIVLVTRVITPHHITLTRLSNEQELAQTMAFLNASSEFFHGDATNVTQLAQAYDTALQQRRNARDAYQQRKNRQNERRHRVAEDNFGRLNATVGQVLDTAAYEHTRQIFQRVSPLVIFFAALTAIGVGAFSYATSTTQTDFTSARPSGPPYTLEPDTAFPKKYEFDLTEEAWARLKVRLGDKCSRLSLEGIGWRKRDGGLEIVTFPKKDCASVRFTVTDLLRMFQRLTVTHINP